MLKISFFNGEMYKEHKVVCDVWVSEFESVEDLKKEIYSQIDPGDGDQLKVETIHLDNTSEWEAKWALDQQDKSIEVFEEYFKIKEILNDDEERENIFNAYLELTMSDEITIREAKLAFDSYVGWYESAEDFARDHYDSQCNYSIPVEVMDYVDWDSLYENELSSDYVEYDGYFFEEI